MVLARKHHAIMAPSGHFQVQILNLETYALSSEFNLVNILGHWPVDYGAIWALSVTSVPNILKSELRECVLLLQCVLFQ